MDPIEALLVINIIGIIITLFYDIGRLYYERRKVEKMDKVPAAAVARTRKEKLHRGGEKER